MTQQEIQFFWPLREQIPLDLDYTGCAKPKLSYGTVSATDFGFATLATSGTNNTWVAMNINPDKLIVDVEQVCFKQRKKPNLFRRMIYKIIGINWELK